MAPFDSAPFDSFPFRVAICAAMVGWVFRAVLLHRMRKNHPKVFLTELGAPTLRQLLIPSISWQQRSKLRRRLMKFLWRFEYLKLQDGTVLTTGSAAVICDVVVLLGAFGMILDMAVK